MLSVDQMTEFINNKQRDPRLNEILYPPLRPAQTHTAMERYQHDQAQLKQGTHLDKQILLEVLCVCLFVIVVVVLLFKKKNNTQVDPRILF